MSKNRILFIGTIASANFNFRFELLQLLVSHNFDVHVAGIDYNEEQISLLNSNSITVYNYPLNRSGKNPFYDLITLLYLVRIIKKCNPNVVFSYFSKPIIYGTIAAKLCGIKTIFTLFEGLGYTFTKFPTVTSNKKILLKYIQIYLYKISLPFADKILFLNNDDPIDLLDRYRIKNTKKIIIGPIGVDISKFFYSQPPITTINFLFVGRLIEEKGIYEFLNAATKIKSINPQINFYVIGDIDDSRDFDENLKLLNLIKNNQNITHVRHVNNIYDWYCKASVFVLPSYREGFPRSTQEAMSVGRPIITTDAPGCRETIKDNINGFLIPAYDSNILFEKMLWFINNPSEIINMGLESRKIAQEKYDIKKINYNIFNLINDSLLNIYNSQHNKIFVE